ncbi:DUF2971 domain-containing protein [Terriglobus saanensis]|uniref:DUF2971 domain-containing protein n=1 Tax=Terriglobus saanensis (strain ATCC BAA-1853 / DSM 23119 / SP1PR4) TaxID=401053 RepID=E8V5D6_TERSS|nr:DUF2971 domain-containing protein [Terriglobus saanensis]ADV84895.1 hypothetical protein AciPR4_4149 [Terriglobus saanensis SP1PR4]
MDITLEENEKYRRFVSDVAKEMGVFEFSGDDIIWHYTNGAGLLGILQSSTLFASQVSCLNDTTETKYATDLYKKAVAELIQELHRDQDAVEFLNRVLDYVKEEPDSPTHGTSKFFVTCFSGDEDELTQWDRYAKPNGYAIGFYIRGLWREATSQIYRVTYDPAKQLAAAKKIATATLDFYREGLIGDRRDNPAEWGKFFFAAWDEWVYKLAPLAKDKKWQSENEFRLVHELKVSEFPNVRFAQKPKMMARYLALDTPAWVKRRSNLLPIAKVWIGPGNHPAFSKVSVQLLLEQMGYPTVPVEATKCTIDW